MSDFHGVAHMGIHVSNLERSIEFYAGCLGFTVHLHGEAPTHVQSLTGYPGAGIKRAILVFPGDLAEPGAAPFFEIIEFQQVEKAAVDTSLANPGTAHIALWVRDLDALYSRLLGLGVRFVSEVIVAASGPNKGGKAVFALDPDGIAVGLVQPSVWPLKL